MGKFTVFGGIFLGCLIFAIGIMNKEVEAMEVISGKTLGKGIVCYRVTLDSGEDISIVGHVEDLKAEGLTVQLKGDWQEYSRCQQGRTFYVESHQIQ